MESVQNNDLPFRVGLADDKQPGRTESDNPYDELPYKSLSIEWTAPERLALASTLHGGPRPPLDEYRVLELGCGDGTNLLPLAYYRPRAHFVGVDGALSQVEIADSRKAAFRLSNIEFLHTGFATAGKYLTGRFDYIIAHGVFSWVSHDVRDALLRLSAEYLARDGLVYLNYNTYPGWKVRGMVRDFLLANTNGAPDLKVRARRAQDAAAQVVASLEVGPHPYTQLIANEFRFVCENDISYVAHEYLAADNHAYWRSEFLSLARRHGFEYIADADFNYISGRVNNDLATRLLQQQICGHSLEDTVDLFCYRQLHSPIMTLGPLKRRPQSVQVFASLTIASCLSRCPSTGDGYATFQHSSGYQVDVKEQTICAALGNLQPLWPRGLRVGSIFPDVPLVMEDLLLLHRNGLIELRLVDPDDSVARKIPLSELEYHAGDCVTNAYHVRESRPARAENECCALNENSGNSGCNTHRTFAILNLGDSLPK